MSAAVKMMEVKARLEALGHKVVLPQNTEKYADNSLPMETPEESSANKVSGNLLRRYFDIISDNDAILVINEPKNGIDGYIGGNTLIEMAFAHILNKPIYVLNQPNISLSYLDEIIAMEPVVLEGNLRKLV